MISFIIKIRIGLLHAAYHRNMKKADVAREAKDIIKFKKYIYAAEDAWRKLVILTNKKIKRNG